MEGPNVQKLEKWRKKSLEGMFTRGTATLVCGTLALFVPPWLAPLIAVRSMTNNGFLHNRRDTTAMLLVCIPATLSWILLYELSCRNAMKFKHYFDKYSFVKGELSKIPNPDHKNPEREFAEFKKLYSSGPKENLKQEVE